MTENKKKTTKKEVVEKSEATVKPKRARTKETKEHQVVEAETSSPEEIVSVTAEEPQIVEEVAEPVKAEVVEAEPEGHKEKSHRKSEAEPVKEVKAKVEHKSPASAEDFDWDSFESEEQRTSPNISSLNHFTMRHFQLLRLTKLLSEQLFR
jgi:hypothetical protein